MRLARRRRARGSDSGSSIGCKGSNVIRWGLSRRVIRSRVPRLDRAAHYSIANLWGQSRLRPGRASAFGVSSGAGGSPRARPCTAALAASKGRRYPPGMGRAGPSLSKSDFLRGWQCPKALYLSAFEPGAVAPPDSQSRARMASGKSIGLLARELSPDGEDAWPNRPRDAAAAAERTAGLIAGRAPAIFEAAFAAEDGRHAAVDILARGRRGWRLIEVKSSTSVKEEHLLDVAFQLSVARAAALEIESVEILHLNSDYTRKGALDLSALFT